MPQAITFETHPNQYKHLKLHIEGRTAKLVIDIQEDQGLNEGYELKLNSYDLSVDIELADAIQRLRFEHPQVRTVVITSGNPAAFSAGANIFMLGKSTHAFKVNFCKFTNETRLALEDATEHSDQRYIAAVNGVCSGGGYELALACDKIYLIDDKKSAVSLPEVPYLGVLPGTGGLTRLVDKRRIRPDRADVFCTLAEGLKGKKAKRWNFVDDIFPASKFEGKIAELSQSLGDEITGHSDAARKSKTSSEPTGVQLPALQPYIEDNAITYTHVTLKLNRDQRQAELHVAVPQELEAVPAKGVMPAQWYPLQMLRELDDALLRLRFNEPEIGLVNLYTRGNIQSVLKMDGMLKTGWEQGHWFAREVLLYMRRVFKRMDLSAKSFFAIVDEGSCFAGSLLEMALSADRAYMLDNGATKVALSTLNLGLLPMSSGLSRIETQLYGEWEELGSNIRELAIAQSVVEPEQAEELGLITLAFDDIDWEDELRLAIEERISLSPDALTGMEANLRFCGPETMESKIFARLSAWQNWIFQRPNAVGPQGALTLYGQPDPAQFDYRRT